MRLPRCALLSEALTLFDWYSFLDPCLHKLFRRRASPLIEHPLCCLNGFGLLGLLSAGRVWLWSHLWLP